MLFFSDFWEDGGSAKPKIVTTFLLNFAAFKTCGDGPKTVFCQDLQSAGLRGNLPDLSIDPKRKAWRVGSDSWVPCQSIICHVGSRYSFFVAFFVFTTVEFKRVPYAFKDDVTGELWPHFQVLSVINAKDDTRPQTWRKVSQRPPISYGPNQFLYVIVFHFANDFSKPPLHKPFLPVCFLEFCSWCFCCITTHRLFFVYRIGFPGVSTSPSFAHAMHVHIVSPRARCAEMMAPRSSNGGVRKRWKGLINQDPRYILGTNISTPKVCLKMIFLCQDGDMWSFPGGCFITPQYFTNTSRIQ